MPEEKFIDYQFPAVEFALHNSCWWVLFIMEIVKNLTEVVLCV